LAVAGGQSLLSQLQRLCSKLYLYGGAILGEEFNAGEGAYPAIAVFSQFYDQLSDEQKSQIPDILIPLQIPLDGDGEQTTSLKAQIELLLTLSDNYQANPDAETNAQTCISNRRIELLAAMRGNEVILHSISIDLSDNQLLLNEMINTFDSSKEILRSMLSAGSYSGFSKLEMNSFVVQCFVPLLIKAMRSPKNFILLLHFSKQEINLLFQRSLGVVLMFIILQAARLMQRKSSYLSKEYHAMARWGFHPQRS